MIPQNAAISVIVPFYNAETTLGRALATLAAQTLTDVEFVLVNDGSTDRSQEIVRQFSHSHPEFGQRMRYHSSGKRKGLAATTAQGMEMAKGRYLARCDADDYVETDWLASMYEATRGEQTDLVIAPLTLEIPGKKLRVLRLRKSIASLDDMSLDTVHFSLCNKLIRRDLIEAHSLRPFDGVNCWEDMAMTARILALKPSIMTIEHGAYHYICDPSRKSLSRERREVLLQEHLLCASKLEEWFIEHGLQKESGRFLAYMKFVAKIKYIRGRGRNVALWKNTFPEANGAIMEMRHIPLHLRLLFRTIDKMPTALAQWASDMLDCV